MTAHRSSGARRGTRSATHRPRLASIARGAEHADVSTRTIRRYIARGLLTGYRVGPRLVKIDLDEIDQLARKIPTADAS
jgi:excisionase family DNA binding protein